MRSRILPLPSAYPRELSVTAMRARAGRMLPPHEPFDVTKHPLLWILLAGLILRLGPWAAFRDQPLHVYDEKSLYAALPPNLLVNGEFALIPGQPSSNRPPLYPLFLASVYRASGLNKYQAVRLVQAGLSLLTVLILYALGTQIDCRR